MAPPILPPFDGRCTRYAPSQKCNGRREAQASGEFFYSFAHKGWVWGENRMTSQLLRDEHKATFCWPFCPWCQGALPDLEGAVEKAVWKDPEPEQLPPTQADGSDTEDDGKS